jgi:hypothetical protein
MTQPPGENSPLKLLEKQTHLLEEINRQQQTIIEQQSKIAQGQFEWFKAFHGELSAQNKKLSNISTVATLFGILLILSIIIGFFNGCTG